MVDLKVGDRVKVTHKAEHDSKVNASDRTVRRRLDGCTGVVSTPTLGGHMVNAEGCRGWFAADELTPKTITGAALPPIGAHVRPKGGLHAGRVLEVMQHRGGEMLAEKGPWVGWYGPDAVEVLVTDPDRLAVEPAVPPVERRCGDGEHVRSITESAKALDRAATHWKREAEEAKEAIDGWVARCDTLRAELATEREARQAADVLARQLGEAANHAQIGEGAARMPLSRVAAAWDAVQCSRRGGMVEDRHNAEDNMVRALAGVPAPVESAGLSCELTVNFSEWRGTAVALPTKEGEPRRWRIEIPCGSAPLAVAARAEICDRAGDKHAAQVGPWIGRVTVVQRAPVVGSTIELDVVEWIEPREYQVEIPRPVVPLGDAADLAALIAKVEADPLHNRGGVVSSALLVDVLRAVERRLVAVETRRPKVGPWTSPGTLHDAGGGTVASVWPSAGGWGWVANRPHLGPLNGTAETEDAAKAAALAVLSTWCDVADAPEPREP